MQPITVTSQAALLAAAAAAAASSNGGPTLMANGGTGTATATATGTGTLRRGILRGVGGVPPPDVTHHTAGATAGGGGSPMQLLHELHPVNLSATTLTTSTTLNGSMTTALPLGATSTLPRQPHGILKDPNRNKQQQQHQLQQQQHLQQQQQLLNASLVGVPGVSAPMGSLQILNLPATSMGLGSNLLMTSSTTYDPASLSSFNAPPSGPVVGPVAVSVAYTDADGHLV